MVIARLMGGLGNQLFIYAAGRRLALKNQVPLRLDVSAFAQDFYRRKYHLSHFNIPADSAAPQQAFAGYGGRIRQKLLKKLANLREFGKSSYITERGPGFDPRLLDLRIKGTVYLDGYWQSEKYFQDMASVIRQDLEIITEHDPENLEWARRIQASEAVALHVRRLRALPGKGGLPPDSMAPGLAAAYYQQGIQLLAEKVKSPVFFCFGDHPRWAQENLQIDFPNFFITNNKGDEKSHEDLWLMSLCKNFIIANSTFSWWGAWLSQNESKIVIAPDRNGNFIQEGVIPFPEDGLPDSWIKL